MIERIRAIRQQKGMTLADVARACRPPTTAQTIGRLETGARNLSLDWMNRIAAALDVDAASLFSAETKEPARVIAQLGSSGPSLLNTPQDILPPGEIDPLARWVVLAIEIPFGEYREGDKIWMRHLDFRPVPVSTGALVNHDILVPLPAGRLAFGRLISIVHDARDEVTRVTLLPMPGHRPPVSVEDPDWIALAETLVRTL